MNQAITQQAALDEALVSTDDRVRIGSCNMRINPTKTQKEHTYQVVLDVLKLLPCYNAFLITADVPKIYMQQFWFTVSKVNDPSLYQFQLDIKNSLHNAIMEAGGKDRPPMFAVERTSPVAEGSLETTTEGYMENYKNISEDIRNKLNAEAEVVHIILTRIDNDIYSTVDACLNAMEINKGKAIFNSSSPTYDQELDMVAKDDALSKELGIIIRGPSMSLISLSFKKIYKPTTLELHQTPVEQIRIILQESTKELARECQKPKWVKDSAYHKEKMLLCKQEEVGFQLNVEQAEWKDDTDDEPEDQELEAYYLYIAQIQEVTPDVAEISGPIFDTEPLEKLVEIIMFIVNSGCSKHMTRNLKLLSNFVEKFLGTVKFGNDQIAPILGYRDLVQGNGNDLLTGSRGTNLYSITLQHTSSPNPICLMAKASSSQAWLWHHRLSHLNFDTINLLSKYDIVTGLPKLKFIKDHLCSSCELEKAKYETPEVLIDFLKLVQRGLHAQVRTVRADKSMEFFNTTLYAYFAQEVLTPVPQCLKTALEQDSLSPGPQSQENVPHAAETVTTSNELDLLFSPMFDELLNGTTLVMSKSSIVHVADAPD
ncbi:retrovirus-related pol polyprotein from transposon TNT 1-94 [Tanacetum coccineum]